MPTKPTQYNPNRTRQQRRWHKGASAPDRLTGRALQERNRRIKIRDRFTCSNKMCRLVTHDLQIDHKVPLTQGGEDIESNLQCLCAACHAIKSKIESYGKHLPDPSSFPLTYKAAKLLLSKKPSMDGDDEEWGDLGVGLTRGGIIQQK